MPAGHGPARLAERDDGLDVFAAAVRATHMPMVITDPKEAGNPAIFVNEPFCQLTGYGREEILGRGCEILYGPDTDPAAIERIAAAIARAEPIEIDVRLHRKDGSAFWDRMLLAPIHDAIGRLAYFYHKHADVTPELDRVAGLESHNTALSELADRLADRTKELVQTNQRLEAEIARREAFEAELRLNAARAEAASDALREREAHLQSVLATVPDAMVIIDSAGVIQSFSATAERLFGYPAADVLGRNVRLLMPQPDQDRHDSYIAHYMATGEKRIIGVGRVVVGLRRDGSTFPMELSVGEVVVGTQHWFTGFVRDLTERETTQKRLHDLQAELVHMSRYTSMGEMASTLAHELNQPLTAVTSYLNGCRRLLTGLELPQAAAVREAVEQAAEQTLRAGLIIRRLRQFVARGVSERQNEDLNTLVEEASALALLGTREDGIRVEYRLDEAIGAVMVDKIQIQQVLLNLIRNAVEAMREVSRREMTFRTSQAGEMVQVCVSDTGPGIAEEVAAQLFQPFVTTKSHGLGIGLSISRTIVEAHGGRLWAEPNPTGGTIFHFTLRRTGVAENGNVG